MMLDLIKNIFKLKKGYITKYDNIEVINKKLITLFKKLIFFNL